MSDKLSASDNPANREHMCAKQVVHEKWGKGDCIPTMHADPDQNGHVEWYDVMFEHGIVTRVPVDALDVTLQESHSHSKGKKKMNEEDDMDDDDMVKCPKCGDMYDEEKGHKCSEAEMEEGMDPVGQEDGDLDNDGDEDESDKYLKMRRKAISKALSKKKK